ncbi:MAG: ParB/RepB/Spo0J family partition protein [Granulosicoccus sp.]|nr:ParB/RepB/Spo0J family partition protein [Granulosicoccus sp.]
MGALLDGVTSQHAKSARVKIDDVGELPGEIKADRPVNTDAGAPAASASASASDKGSSESLRSIPVEKIRRGTYQPRKHFDQEALQELADSLKAQGMIQPILVRPFAGAYEIVAGERRWRAAQLAGIQAIPAIVRELDDQSVAAVSLIENIQRKDLNPLEEARALQRLQTEFGMTHQAVAEAVGRSRAAVTNLLRLLDLHEEVKVMLDRGDLDMGHARALLGLEEAAQVQLAEEIINKGLSVRATEKRVREDKQPKAKAGPQKRRDPDIVQLEKSLGETLGAPVAIRHLDSGGGKLEIGYTTLEELEGILAHIR